ncbi:NAD(P)/FAD-dependent oxidoreductase [Bacillus taeanensis]|uniref:FAD-dependent oxidoreductase n=1 Tax=Bacillus taeanensis TaxID=273032 RepID=A0A366Y4I9_9BACI|nr:NAD(P)/FAD-dependent oxidoreductase [Bacillus taeanensis]RBW71304.1 FAD-dependent oxidoreductase [Bacillus taeanensis]
MSTPKIVILGAGYGGMMTATRLQKQMGANEAEVTLVNKHNYHYQTTWLHEPAAGTLHHDRTRIAIEDVIDKNKVKFVQDTVVEIKKDEQKVILKNGELTYDYLVIGLGFEPETFGIKGLKENAFSIRSVNSVRKIREHIEYQFASYNNDKEKQEERLTFIVGGAGFSGIEFIGELADRVPELCHEFDIDREKVRVINVEAAPTILPGFDQELVDYAKTLLESKGIEFKLGTMIKECKEDGVVLSKDDQLEEIKANTVVWTGGVRGNSILEKSGFEAMRGRIKVEKDLRAPGFDNVFVVGDCALIINEEIDRPYPPTAQIAIQQSYTCSHNLLALIRGGHLESFNYSSKGTVASLGKGEAIGKVGNKHLYGGTASAMKKIIDNRYLFLLGGPSLVLKKGKLKLF